ncbi:MAG: histidine kinase [Actinomycetota bacterium]
MRARTARIVSRGLLIAALGLFAVSLPLISIAAQRAEPGRIVVIGDPTAPRMAEVRAELEVRLSRGDDLMPSVNRAAVVLAFVALLWLVTGLVIVSRQPHNSAGWILMAIGLTLPVYTFCEAVMGYGVRASDQPIGGAAIAAVLGEFALFPVGLLPLLFLLFPHGRAPSLRWRWATRALFAGLGLAIVSFSVRPGPLNNWVQLGILYENPLGVDALGESPGALILVGTVTALLAALATVIAVRQRFRRSTGEERQQMRWLVFVATAAGTALIAMFLFIVAGSVLGLGETGDEPPIFDIAFGLVAFTIALGVPGAYLIAILRYRLWELDVVIRKTVVFAVVVGFISLLYALVAVGLPVLFVEVGGDGGPFTLAATVLLVLLFQPVKERARHLADRVVYGKRATPYEVLSEFSDRMAEAYSTEEVLPRMASILAAGTGADHARVWLRIGGELRPAASWPGSDDDAGGALVLAGDRLPDLPPGEHAYEVRHQGELLGALSVSMPASDPIDPGKETLVRDLASQAGLVLRNVRLIEELRASRQRIVAAQDEERRRIERNIHDGAQQQLVALSVRVGLAKGLVGRDPDAELRALDELQREAAEALENLRDLARGIYPPLLADQGLVAALRAQARKAPILVEIEADGVGRYPQEVEAAVYFCTLEALQNVAKYARASRASIRLSTANGMLKFDVIDDGRGFDPEVTAAGSGLTNMRDRLEALGGELEVSSKPGQGTTVSGRVPERTMERQG